LTLLALTLLTACDLSAPLNEAGLEPLRMRRFASEEAACVAGGTFGAAQSLAVCEAAAVQLSAEAASDSAASRNALVFYYACLSAAPDDEAWCDGYRASGGFTAAMWIKTDCGEDSYCKLRMQEERRRCQPEAARKEGIKNLPEACLTDR